MAILTLVSIFQKKLIIKKMKRLKGSLTIVFNDRISKVMRKKIVVFSQKNKDKI